jgi:hypothetical protein
MINVTTFNAMQAALAQPMDPALHRLLSDRVADAVACGCEHLTHLIICEPGDTEADFLREAGFSPFYNPLSGWRYGDACFSPHWDWADHHDGWFEWLTCIGNDGFARIVLVPEVEGIDPALLAMLREHLDESF